MEFCGSCGIPLTPRDTGGQCAGCKDDSAALARGQGVMTDTEVARAKAMLSKKIEPVIAKLAVSAHCPNCDFVMREHKGKNGGEPYMECINEMPGCSIKWALVTAVLHRISPD